MTSSSKNLLSRWLTKTSQYPQSTSQRNRLTKRAHRAVLTLFHDAAERVPAYRKFLTLHAIHHEKIITLKDFLEVPLTTKENYIEKYSLSERMWDGHVAGAHMISTSSGTTGKPSYWPRTLAHEIDGAVQHEFFMRTIFDADKKSTLFINGFALGNWIAGTFTSTAMQLVIWKGYPITLMSPGYNLEAVISVVRDMSRHFAQTVITGHTPFLKEVVEALVAQNLHKGLSLRLLGTGQGITESWREYIRVMVESKAKYSTMINLYGSADAALMGFETPLSVGLRQWIVRNDETNRIFYDTRLPSLYQYDPTQIYFEPVNGELCITKNGGCPLIRYNIHDTGGVYEYDTLIHSIPAKTKLSLEKVYPWQLPFVYLFGRDKFMVKLYGANIYTEHVQKVTDHPKLTHVLSGRFLLDIQYDSKQNQQLILRVEARTENISPTLRRDLIEEIFVSEVSRVNTEYSYIVQTMGKKVHPKVQVYPHGHKKYFPKGQTKKTA
ncbi:phenylacetate--CoA ligase family protein [Candidatus Woesebacteria bacterium]|nr:phenylacetate--CoA ligase family protein [Candidatus Woesebacteria bacterium]